MEIEVARMQYSKIENYLQKIGVQYRGQGALIRIVVG